MSFSSVNKSLNSVEATRKRPSRIQSITGRGAATVALQLEDAFKLEV